MGWASIIMDTEPISSERMERWKKCMVKYDELPEEEKQKDIEVANKILNVWKEYEIDVMRSKGMISDLTYSYAKGKLENDREGIFINSSGERISSEEG